MQSNDKLFDDRTKCWSIQTTMTIREYIDLVHDAHQNQGSIAGQRGVLTTTTAKRIRSRMVADLKQGAIMPPVVIGAVLDKGAFEYLTETDSFAFDEVLDDAAKKRLSIIDGMQRTASMLDAIEADPSVGDRRLRVEFWLTTSVRAMVYRMLVLNTGQVPWTINRQLSVVYSPLLSEVEQKVPELVKLISDDSPGRRVGAAQYQSDSIVELYIAFSLRKTSIDTKEHVSDEFSRLDFVDNVADQDFQEQFYQALSLLARLDKAFSRFESTDDGRMTKGRHVFDSQPARIGFIVAIGIAVLGRPGANRPAAQRGSRMDEIGALEDNLLAKLGDMSVNAVGDFMRLDVLREVLDRKSSQVGRYERGVFGEAFKVLIEENFTIDNMEQCWRAA